MWDSLFGIMLPAIIGGVLFLLVNAFWSGVHTNQAEHEDRRGNYGAAQEYRELAQHEQGASCQFLLFVLLFTGGIAVLIVLWGSL